jgi:Zn-finger nucleic acid-binding protein
MQCPKCFHTLETKKFGDVEVEQCPNCQGVWLDIGELRRVRLQKTTHRSSPTSDSNRFDTITAPCPHCGGEGHMTRLSDLERPDVMMESCPVCYGIWLDGGELDKLTQRGVALSLKAFVRDLLEI